MNERDFHRISDQVLSSLGGLKEKHQDGEFWLFSTGCVELTVEPFTRSSSSETTIGIEVSYSNPELSRVVDFICGRQGKNRTQFRWEQFQQTLQCDDASSALRNLVQKAVAVAEETSLDGLVEELATTPPLPKSLSQLLHLAALSYSGGMRTLSAYLDAMRTEKRYGFVPMITEVFIRRAIQRCSGGE